MSKRNVNDHALYKGEELLFIGTVDEVADYLGWKRRSVLFLKSPTNFKRGSDNDKRLKLYELEDDE